MTPSPQQSWIAECRWEGRKAFWCGTFFTERGDGIEAARRAAEAHAVEWFREILPVDLPAPDHIRLIPGILVLYRDE